VDFDVFGDNSPTGGFGFGNVPAFIAAD
jgi:hypothetical protein